MERANPEVKLALSVERRLRRPAPQLHALLATAERQARSETGAEALLSAADPLAVLAALLAAPDAGSATDRVPGRLRRLAPVPALPEGRRGAVDADLLRPEGIGHHGESPRMPVAGRVVSLPAPPPSGAAVDRAGIAQARAALRHVIAALPDAADTAHRLQGNAAQPPRRAPPDPLQSGHATAHVLVAAAREGAGTTRAGEAATAAVAATRALADRALAAHAMAGLAEGALQAAAADLPAHAAAPLSRPAADLTPAQTNAPAGPAPVTHTPAGEGAAPVPAPAFAASPPPAPRSRANPMLTLDDGADALAEAAWRNGVDLSWP